MDISLAAGMRAGEQERWHSSWFGVGVPQTGEELESSTLSPCRDTPSLPSLFFHVDTYFRGATVPVATLGVNLSPRLWESPPPS